MKTKSLFTLLLTIAWLLTMPLAFGQNSAKNLSFEEGAIGQPPPGWFVPPMVTGAGYVVQTTSESPKDGKKCLVISLTGRKGEGFGNILQSVDVKPYRGKKIRFRAAVRMQRGNEFGQAQLWFRVDRPNGQQGFFDNMGNRPITSSSWAFYEIAGTVAEDAENITFGLLLAGGGSAYLDAVSLEIGDATPTEPVDPPKALTDRGLQNLVAFTKLYGYIRHFHPSDAVEKADWDAYAMAGVKAAEDAKDPADLAQRLQTLFAPIAPSVRVFVTGNKPTTPIVAAPPKGTTPVQIAKWENTGFGGGTNPPAQNIYRSRRVFTPKPATGNPAGMDPAVPFEADLGGGVSCQVPMALYAQNNSALPPTVEPVIPKGVRQTPTGNDRTSRLAAVVVAWNVYEHFYPYFDEVKVDWAPVLPATLSAAATDANELAFLKTLRRLVASAKDGHGYVGHPSDNENVQPAMLADWVEDKFVVTAVPAGVTRTLPGDVIVSIDGKSTEDRWKEIEPTISGATEQWRRYRGKTEMLKGTEGSFVEIVLKRGNAEPYKLNLIRNPAFALREKRPKPIEEVKLGIWYVDLDGGRCNMEDFKKAIKDLSGAQGVIFDMRGYPNEVAMEALPHVATVPITSATWNIPKVVNPDHVGMEFVQSRWPMREPAVPKFRGKIAFITDGRAISYAESVMGIVENYKLGAIVGEPTAGTNGNVNPFQVPGGYTLVFTGMKVIKHDGSQHHGVGILPTVPVKKTIAGVTAGKDEMLDKAIEIVKG